MPTIMKQTLFLILVIFVFFTSACSTAETIKKVDTSDIVNWGTTEGIHRLEESKYKIDFFKLANNFEGQTNKIFCGPTSAAIILNSLRIRNKGLTLPQDKTLLSDSDLKYLPTGKWTPFYERYSQNNVFLQSPKSREFVLGKPLANGKGKPAKDIGFQIRQLGELLMKHGLIITVRIVTQEADIRTIKKEIIENLRVANDYVIVNYKRSVLNQPGGGHISPLGAYHKASDSFLILDVTPNKADWVWVKAELLIRAMRTFDTIENRGYLLIREGL